LLATHPLIDLIAADIDLVAVECARRNLGGRARIVQGDLYSPLPTELKGAVDVIAVNAPYVPTDEIALMPPEARLYEARTALDGGTDGLDFHRRVASEASDWLDHGGRLVIETSVRQAATTAAIFGSAGLTTGTVHSDELDATIVIGVKS
jgi:release factor glutamine methyltransferase